MADEPLDAPLHLPPELEPIEGEAAVLSTLVARDGSDWALVAGSLLTVPAQVSAMSWPEWRERQPHVGPRMEHVGGIEPGPRFTEEPFPGVRAIRQVFDATGWRALVMGLGEGRFEAEGSVASATITRATPTVFLGQGGQGEAYDVIDAACRPVRGVVLSLEIPEVLETEDTWALEMPEDLEPGPERGRLWQERHLLHWPQHLLGIDWLGSQEFAPPARFVVGRTLSNAWIVRVRPDFEAEALIVSIAWDETVIDPLGCSLILRAEKDGLPLFERRVAITDLPELRGGGDEPRTSPWHDRTLDVVLARGSRRTDWGLALLSSSGELLDERPVATRIEEIRVAIHVEGSTSPASVVHVGDKKPVPSDPETDASMNVSVAMEGEARQAAGKRRLSTAGELAEYLRWRFSCRDGELLLLDPYLLQDKPEDVLRFLSGLNRPIRALARSLPAPSAALLKGMPQIEARALPGGKSSLHDRVWIVGESGILVGTSVGSFLAHPERTPRRATTATDLPYADTVLWRDKFEEWWSGP